MKKRLLVALGLFVGVGAGLLSIRIHHAVTTAKAELAIIRHRKMAETAAAQRQITLATGLSEKVAAAIDASGLTAEGKPLMSRDPLRMPRTAAEFRSVAEKRSAALAADPAMQLLYWKRTRGFTLQEFGPFFVHARLSADAIDRFLAAAANHEMQLVDLDATAAQQGPDARAVMSTLKAKAAADREAAFRAILGDAGYGELQEYRRTSEVRKLVARLAGEAVSSAMPLSADQAEAVANAIVNASASFRAGGPATISSVDWTIVDPRLREILGPAQIAVLFAGRGERQLNASIQRALGTKPSLAAEASAHPGG